jgi:hypothetical protein
MSASFEAKKNSQATMITAGFAGLMILLMFLLKWSLPVIEHPIADMGVEVNLDITDEEIAKVFGGGGGGGNPVQASGPAGPAPYTPPQPGVDEESKDIETDDNDKENPPVVRPTNPKPVNKVIENTSVVKATPKPVINNPAPLKPKAVLGKTVSGNNTGGGAADDYARTGGTGNGTGVGNGPGNGGGTGGGNGGGNGPGSGTGTGPRKISGNRIVINPKSMNAGENIAGKVLAEIKVSPDGIGTFIRGKGGSLMNDQQALSIVRDWLRRNHFNKSEEESVVTYEFNIKMGG